MANKSTLIGRRNYGMKIAMPGFDAQYAGDNQLLFNSSFPILQIKILAELYALGATSAEASNGGEFIGTTSGSNDRVYRWYHGLGYPPFFLVLNQSGIMFSANYMVDEQYIYRRGDWTGAPVRDGSRVLLCPIDLEQDIEYPYTAKPLEAPMFNELNYGFKSVEFGSIEDDNFNNLGIDMRLQSQMLLAVKTYETSTMPPGSNDYDPVNIDFDVPEGMTVNDVTAYGFAKQPLDFADANSPAGYISVGQSSQAPPSVFIGQPTANSIRLTSLRSQPGSLVLVRQPMVMPNRSESTI